jgi:acetyltransferase-like isoleucine patch superfamily enzyme
VVAISTSVDARARLRALCEAAGAPLANAIDPRVKLATGVTIGSGNVICAYCHFGTETRIGDNNFISAYNSYDHHNVLGNDISTGPGCMTSGEVTLEDRVRLGAGVFVEPKVVLGEGVMVASGAVIVRSVPAHHAVKTKVVTTTVVPVRPRP